MMKMIGESIRHLWISFGTKKNFRYIPIHKIVDNLGIEKSKALSLFHALSGCDTTSSSHGRGKKTFWDTWSIFPDLTKSILNLLEHPGEIDQEFTVIEKIFVLLYDRSSQLEQVDDARQTMYKTSFSLELIPPTKASLYQHVKRSVLQGAFIWGQCMEKMQDIPDPTAFGWTLVEDQFEPFWTTLPDYSRHINTTRCGCKVACKGRCKCKGNCSLLCTCEGRCKDEKSKQISMYFYM
ncbi:uncharacterized protein LOC119082058 [Bradysia coprophila]|uniref:uncharacterized protein LOC119082058 n=1 Tax=Bradysia coprophila TaxID=38358 RepID=UPI00187DB197|nr:uncharacterized protein LOC119082058 [Bradysia coprophila]